MHMQNIIFLPNLSQKLQKNLQKSKFFRTFAAFFLKHEFKFSHKNHNEHFKLLVKFCKYTFKL